MSSRYDLVIRVIERLAEAKGIEPLKSEYGALLTEYQAKLKEHAVYVWEEGEDMPEIKNWTWKNK